MQSAQDPRPFREQDRTRRETMIDLRLYVKSQLHPFLGTKLLPITKQFMAQGYRYPDLINAWWALIGRQEIERREDGWWRT